MNILNKLTIKHLSMNKKRTIVTIIGVILSTALMIGIGLLFSSIRDNSVKEIIYKNGSQHVIISSIRGSDMPAIEKNIHVASSSYYTSLGYAKIESENEYKPYYHIVGSSDSFLKLLSLKEGRLPKNDREIVISDHIKSNGGIDLHVGDTITLSIGKRYLNGEELVVNDYYYADEEEGYEEFKEEGEVTYNIVGIVERSYIESYSAPGYSIFTYVSDINEDSSYTMLLTFKNIKKAYAYGNDIAESLGYKNISSLDFAIYDELEYNDSLLSMSGVSRYDNFMSSIYTTIVIILVLISIGCIVVIYNSFAISVMERKKQFGLFSSIGATKRQLRKTVFFEAFIVGIIGIPLGILGGFIGIGIVLTIVNALLPDVFSFPLVLAVYPTFIIIPVVFMIVVIILSAYLPAVRASRITPIEAIRQNDDIKIKGKKIRTPKWISSIFGVEGEIALKNMKRNKKKYRITILSLFISIVLFVSFSGILYYGFTSTVDVFNLPEYNITINMYGEDEKSIQNQIHEIVSHEEIDNYTILQSSYFMTESLSREMFDSDFVKKMNFKYDNSIGVALYGVDDATYAKLKKSANITEDVPFVLNRFKGTIYSGSDRKSYDIAKYKEIPSAIRLCEVTYDDYTEEESFECNIEINDAVLVKENVLGLEEELGYQNEMIILVNHEMYSSYIGEEISPDYSVYIQADKYDGLNTYLDKLEEDSTLISFHYYNIDEELKVYKNMILVVKILLYGFISLVTLIGVTSVFNTIHTSINLRRKEFAMLRSMGLTPKGFNKILAFESLFVGVKSLLYGLPVSIGVVYLLYKSFGGIADSGVFVIPWDSILVATVGVFIIVFITMMYASSKIKHENILEAIREENI